MVKKNQFNLFFIIIFTLNINNLLSQVDVIGDQVFITHQNNEEVSLPLFSNVDIGSANNEIQKVIIVVHGQNRNANDYFNSINSITNSLGIQEQTLVIAPQFLRVEDVDFWDLDSTIIFWQNTTGWNTGNLSSASEQHPRQYQISSFEVMDSLLTFIFSTFSNIDNAVLIGHSAGGQFVNRYAGGSPHSFNNKVEFIISGPSSFLYFDEHRYQQPNTWAIPSGCSDYNEYKYGLDGLNSYMGAAGADSIRSRYKKRVITYLSGAEDNGGTNDCESMVQGQDRLERSLYYYNYIQYFFGQEIIDNQKIVIIPNVGHEYQDLFISDCGKKAIFGVDGCAQIESPTSPTAQFSSVMTSGDYPLTINFLNDSYNGTYDIEHTYWKIKQESLYANGNLEYTFNQPGKFDVGLIVIDQIGLKDTIVLESFIAIDTLFGDINLDTQINQADVDDILSFSIGDINLDSIQLLVGDVSRDANITPFDGSLLLQYIEGTLNIIPIENLEDYAASGHLNELELFGEINEIIEVPITLKNVNNVTSFQASITYDSDVLSSATAYAGNIADLDFSVETKIDDQGTIAIAGAGPYAIDTATTLVTLYFIQSQFANDETVLSCSNLILNDTPTNEDFSITISQTLSTGMNSTPNTYTLGNNFPNPFNSNTTINFHLNEDLNIDIYITNLKGQLVKPLLHGHHLKGSHKVNWDGKDENGRTVVSGIYLYKIFGNNNIDSRKMLYLK